MPGVNLGSAAFTLTGDASQLIRAIDDSEKKVRAATASIAQSMGVAEQSVTKAYKSIAAEQEKATQAAAKSTSGFGDLLKSGLALGAGFAGVQLGAEAVHQALVKVADQTQKTADLQFQMSKTYGESAGQMTKFATDLAAATGKSNLSVQEGIARFSVLERGYGLTRQQTEALTKRTLDLAAATGVDTVEAFERVIGVFRDGGESAEKLGLVLNDQSVKAFANLTKEQKKNFEQMDAVEKSQIRLSEAMKQSAFASGSAAEKANTQAGAYGRLQAAGDNLAASMGKAASAGSGGGLVGSLADATQTVATFTEKVGEAREALDALERAGNSSPTGAQVQAELDRRRALPSTPQIGPDPGLPGSTTGGMSDAAARTAIQNLLKREEDRQKAIADLRKEARATESKAQIDAAEAEHDRDVKALDAKKVLLEVEKDAKLKAVEAQKDAALAGIDAEAKASKEASDAHIAHLHVLETAEKQSASDRHDREVAGIEASQKAAEDAVGENIRNLEIERDRAKQASEDKRDAAIKAMDDEKTARDAARVLEDRAVQDSVESAKRAEDDRHQGVLRGLDEEAKALNDKKDAALRALDEELKAYQRGHEDTLKSIQEEADAAHKQHDSAVRAIDEEAKRASDAHDLKLQALSDEADADRDAAAAADRVRDAAYEADSRARDAAYETASRQRDTAYETESRQRDAAHEAAQRNLDAEAEADKAAAEQAARIRDAAYEAESRQRDELHAAAVRGFEAEADAAKNAAEEQSRAREAAHTQVLAQIDQEADAAHAAHDRAMADLDRQKDAEDDRHRAAMAAIDEEERRRQDAVDAQIAALDALDQADQNAAQDKSQQSTVTNARFGLLRAQSTGNLSEIIKAQQELDDALAAIDQTKVKRERDVQRDALQAQKDRIKEEEDARREAENELNRQHQREIDAAKETADAVLKAVLDALADRKTAENTSYAAASLASKDALTKVLADIDARKLAESDAYKAAKQQAEDSYKATKLAADDALTQQLVDIAKRKLDEQEAYAAARLAAEDSYKAARQAAEDAYKAARQAAEDSYKAASQAADDALVRQLDDIARRTRAEDDAYRAGQDRRAAEKQQLDDALTQQLARIAKEKLAEDDAYDNAKDKLDKRKIAVGDANKDELDKIAARKTAEQDAHDNAVILAGDQATAEKRAVQDRRDAEDLADKAKRIAIQDAYTNEERDRHARYDDEATGEIPALHRALEAAQGHFKERKDAADAQYQSETHQIDDTYNNAEHGLIPLATKAAKEVADRFRDQAVDVNASAASQKGAINDLYSNVGHTGLLDLIEQAKADTNAKLGDQRKYWEDWKEDLAGPEGKIPKVIGKFDELVKKILEAGGTVAGATGGTGTGGSQSGGRQGGPGGDAYHGDMPSGNAYPGGAGSSATVPSPYRVTFPFDAPYNGPFAGGAAWKDGPSRHRGVDLALPGPDNGRGTPYGAFQAGTVEALIPESSDPAGGNGIIIRTGSGLFNYYGHNDAFLARQGEHVERGQHIGVLGRSGLDGGMQTHLHYEVRRGMNGDPVGSTINPVPYMNGAGGAGGQTFEFDLFGRHFSFRLPFGTPAGDVGKWIAQALQAAGLPSDWLVPMEQIAAAESGERNADGSVQIGTGSATAVNPEADENGERASGLMQMKPSTFRGSRLHSLPNDIFNPVANAAAAGLYIQHHPDYGDPRNTAYFDSGHFDWRGVPGYAAGGWAGLHGPEMARLGELGPELVIPNHALKGVRAPQFMSGANQQPYQFAAAALPERLAVGAGADGSSLNIDLRGATSYDGHRFEDLMVRVLTRADIRGRLTFLQGGA